MPRSARYEPRRRAVTAGHRGAQGAHRTARRSRLRIAVTTTAVTTTVVTALIAFVLAPAGPLSTAGSDAEAAAGLLASALDQVQDPGPPAQAVTAAAPKADALPAGSGSGRRVVFDISRQRVWLLSASGHVRRTYAVSGSRHKNLRPGRYHVYSRTRHATSFDLRSTMDFFVRFTKGKNAAIGFHDIPLDRSGDLVQPVSDLGRPLSSGCIRQKRADARAMWAFAPTGTKVVVVA